MTLYAANGTRLSKTAAAAKVESVPVADPVVKVTENLYEGVRSDGTDYPEGQRKLKFPAGALIRQSELNACFPDATIASVTPAEGDVAGGTAVTIRGSNFTPGTTVKFGNSSATSVVVRNETTITCVTPAGSAGEADVVVTTDAGEFTAEGAFTYTEEGGGEGV